MKERWNYLVKVRENPSFDEDNTDSQEVLDDVLIRVMAREYMDTVKAILTSGKHGDANNENSNAGEGQTVKYFCEVYKSCEQWHILLSTLLLELPR